jgi:pyruvate formate lyase activating enzyme
MTRDVKCTGCGACAGRCARGAIHINAQCGRQIDWDKCDQCLACVGACLYGSLARSGDPMTVESVFAEVLRDRLFYKNSGGGITVSGGEPLLQSQFVADLLRRCRQENLHTAVDTTGHVAWPKIEAVAPWTELMLWDIKHLDPQAHEHATGVGNQLILENLERASELVKIWLRIPLIEGFNDSADHMDRVIALALKHHIEKISLLAYHEGGRTKCEQIGIVYPCAGARAPAEEKMDQLKAMITHAGIAVGIGH